jgi:hypothetical protein
MEWGIGSWKAWHHLASITAVTTREGGWPSIPER